MEPANQHPEPRDEIEEGEIGVFGAEKYFNMELDDGECPKLYDKYSNQIDLHLSASSETSWNIQSVSLPNFTRSRSENRRTKVDGRSFFSSLGSSGSSSDGKSVYLNQNVVHGKDYSKEHIRADDRPIDMVQAKFKVEDEFDTQSFDPRKSLEVFGSSGMNKGDIAKNLERKLCMLTWDAFPNAPTISSIYKSRLLGDDDDEHSEGSSDLFEIGNILGDGEASDGMSSCMMTPYAPSETSIQWSVVTASTAADCSFVSGYDDETKSAKSIRAPASKTTVKEAQRSRSGGILGCRRHKAVMVAESTAYRKRW
ncbi:hypothetical protein Gohar_018768 [Gossypium harknessii]|uniref:Protein PHYTOCHROME KINASE SUBSTRATE 1-like n=1 Tax=Gossypium harknessii TaxID=34285 RepID=A0A7J9GA31_9ROSI|nr:hypothetical protein [Gossypium harknessii]